MFNVGDEVVIAVTYHKNNLNRIVTVRDVYHDDRAEFGTPLYVVEDSYAFDGFKAGAGQTHITSHVLGLYGWKLRPLLATDTVIRDDDGPLRVYMTY